MKIRMREEGKDRGEEIDGCISFLQFLLEEPQTVGRGREGWGYSQRNKRRRNLLFYLGTDSS